MVKQPARGNWLNLLRSRVNVDTVNHRSSRNAHERIEFLPYA